MREAGHQGTGASQAQHHSSHRWTLATPGVQFSSVAQSCLTFCNPMNCSTPRQASLSINSWSPPKLMSIELVMPSYHLILCSPLLFLPSIFTSIRVFSNELALRSKWLKYWSFSFNISPSNEYSELISFRIDRFDLCCPGLSRVFSSTSIRKDHFFGAQSFLWSSSHIHT